MPPIPLKRWAKRRKVSLRKAELLANKRPDLIVMLPQKIVRTVFVKCIDESLSPADFALRSKNA